MGRHSASSPARSRHVLPAALAIALLSFGGGVVALVKHDTAPTGSSEPSPGGQASDVPASAAGGRPSGPGCPGGRIVNVSTTPEIAPVVRRVATSLTSRGGDGCVQYTVSTAPAGETADAIAEGAQGAPQIWIPDSPMWLNVVNARTRSSMGYGDVVATSPVGLAVPKSLVNAGARTGKHSWDELLKSPHLRIGMASPDSSTASMLTLVSARRAADDPAKKRAAQAGIAAASRNSAPESDLMRRATTDSPQASVFPASEQQMLTARSGSGSPVDAISIADGATPFEYGVVGVDGTDAPPTASVSALRQALTSAEGKADLQAAGFRVPGAEPQPDQVLVDAPATTDGSAAPTTQDVDGAIAAWSALRRSMRMIVGIDVSGSMLEPVTPTMNRIELATAAAQRALKTLPDDAKMGVWLFSYERGPQGEPWFQAAPIRPLSQQVGSGTQRSLLTNLTASIPEMPKGGTALFDTISAAVKAARQGYDPNRVNSVVFWTDGINEDAPTMPKAQLLEELRTQAKSDKPVRVILVGMGDKADMGTLNQIASASGGTAYDATDPKNVDDVILGALTARMEPAGKR